MIAEGVEEKLEVPLDIQIIWKENYKDRQKLPLSDLFGGFVGAVLKDGIRPEPILLTLAFNSASHHYTETIVQYLLVPSFARTLQLYYLSPGRWMVPWVLQKRRRERQGKCESISEPMQPRHPPTWLFLCLPPSRTLAITSPHPGLLSPSFPR